ncbi:hypothetical protein FJZ31_38010 [Candidatus Poribacteria bacterium]|nr:hypothetical protein [Candidatus Poribacteria bacterium]
MARRISETKRRHEAHGYTRSLLTTIYQYSEFIEHVDTQTIIISSDGSGQFYIPSLALFQQLVPHSTPIGVVFYDGSFLTIKEIFRYDYANNEIEPRIIRSEFSYHYQSPPLRFFFRYDYHPGVGNLTTHPLYHLHVGCWHSGEEKFSGKPRFRVPEVMLEEV